MTQAEKQKELLQTIAKNIQALRKERGIAQEVLAWKADIDRTYMGYIENARYNVSIGKLQQIALALEVELADLIHSKKVTTEQPVTDLAELNRIFPAVREYQKLAERHGINDVFQDNGGKLLQVLIVMGLENIASREGNDARDVEGREYELKSLNVRLTKSFSTHHHLNPSIIEKYRQVDWVFAVYEGIELRQLFQLPPIQLEPFFQTWAEKWKADGGKDINNPKIPLSFVKANGRLLYETQIDGLFQKI